MAYRASNDERLLTAEERHLLPDDASLIAGYLNARASGKAESASQQATHPQRSPAANHHRYCSSSELCRLSEPSASSC